MNIQKTSSDFARQARRIFKESNFKQDCVAKQLGVTRNRVTQILSGKENLTLETMERVADVLGCSFSVQLDRKSETLRELRFEYDAKDSLRKELARMLHSLKSVYEMIEKDCVELSLDIHDLGPMDIGPS